VEERKHEEKEIIGKFSKQRKTQIHRKMKHNLYNNQEKTDKFTIRKHKIKVLMLVLFTQTVV
jgi:hypothetical protein